MSNLVHSDALDWTRRLLQARLISEVFSDRMEAFVLKGGLAMRVKHGYTRATQDIDLDASDDFPLSNIQSLIRRAIKRSLRGNMLKDVKIYEPKQTETTARWKIKGIDNKTGLPLTLTVEISMRDKILNKDVEEVEFSSSNLDPNAPLKPIRIYNNSAMALRKTKALLCDARFAPRDIIDLYILIKAEVDPPIEEMRQWLEDDPSALSRLWYKIDSMDEEQFKQEVLPSLPPNIRSRDLYKNWDAIRLEVGMHLEDWIKRAQTPQPICPENIKSKKSQVNNKSMEGCTLSRSIA